MTRPPLALFREWFEAAHHVGLPEPAAAALATVDDRGRPTVRIVLVRSADERGFTFYTNLESRKGRELLASSGPGGAGSHAAPPTGPGTPACLNFYWPPLARQVRIEGTATPVTKEEADAYWATRPRGHQVAAYASPQSREISGGREELERLFAEWDRKLPATGVPRPAYWSGFRLAPDAIEFWQGRENRLHERTLYRLVNGGWTVATLAP